MPSGSAANVELPASSVKARVNAPVRRFTPGSRFPAQALYSSSVVPYSGAGSLPSMRTVHHCPEIST